MSTKKKKSAAELAKEGALKREKKQAQYELNQARLKVKQASYRQVSDQRRVFLHITRWYGARYFFLWMAILSVISLLPFLMLNSMIKHEDSWMAEGFIWFFSVPLALCASLFLFSIYKTKKNVLKEKEWIERLPFYLAGYPDLFVYRSYPGFRFTFEFERKKPTAEFILNVVSTLPYDVKPELEYEDVESDEPVPEVLSSFMDDGVEDEYKIDGSRRVKTFRFELSHPSGSKFNRHRRWARHWIILACENQFQAIHEEYPISGIIFGEGHIELNFEWWKPLKKFL